MRKQEIIQVPIKVFIKPLNIIRVDHGHGTPHGAMFLLHLSSFVFLGNLSGW